MHKRKLLIDTDPGHDDALAILLLEQSGLFDILAITTSAGNSTIQNTTNNARYILDLIGSTTPIYSGAASPLHQSLVQAEVHGKSGLAGANITKNEPLTNNAANKIIECVKNNPHEVSILTLGPLTNLAAAMLQDASITPLIQEVIMMGGAIAVPGNKNRVAEFNIYVDPDAADIVFRAPVKKSLIPLDVCNDVYLTMDDFEQLAGSRLYESITAMMRHYIAGIQQFEKTTGALMYDPLAAYYLVNPAAYTTQELDIQIEVTSELTRGMTVADRRIWGEQHPNVTVATTVDKSAFTHDLIKFLRT